MRSPISLLILLCALLSMAYAADSVHLTGNRAGVSQAATRGMATEVNLHRRLIRAEERARQAALTQKLDSGALKVSFAQVASVNVKAFAQGGMTLLLDLASSSNDVLDYIGNGTNAVFSRSEPSEEDNAASGRRRVAYTSVALVLVMLFFAVWM
ncbi:hypothetical protein FZEAL_4389 [Fusarium zealandicum]|uniref:Uncharacterized protein n=1 Tax=Fusarium zealandicum TaxID=1053134 RepID=A0A8H4XLY8_9HYPO|nr:hypothetical protein FZEAL_4389 [Fusarium zealandicum]